MEQPVTARSTARIGAAVVLATLLAAWAFFEFEPLRHRELSHETMPGCVSSGGWRPGMYTTRWEGTTLLVRASEHPNCAEEVKRVSAHVLDDRILLRIRYRSSSGGSYACHCQKVTLVRLSGLAQREYRVIPVWPP